MSDFISMVGNLYDELQNSNKLPVLELAISNEANVENILQRVWALPEFHKNIKLETDPINGKCDDMAEMEIMTGNALYVKWDLLGALRCYNKSITYAANWGTGVSSTCSSSNLARGFYNRAVVFYEISEFKLCLADIKRAFQYGITRNKHLMLMEREINCYFKLQDFEAAEMTYWKYVMSENYCQDLYILRRLKRRFYNAKRMLEVEKISNYEYIPHYVFPSRKVGSMTRSDQYPAASNALKINHNEMGRGFIANRDIQPGEILMQEEAYCTFLFEDSLHTHCSFCLTKVRAPFPCATCINVIFCDEDCREKGNALFHNLECSLLQHFLQLNVGCTFCLTFRMLCRAGANEVVTQYMMHEIQSRECTYRDDPSNLFRLLTHRHCRGAANILANCVRALSVLKCFASVSGDCDPHISDLSESALTADQTYLAASILMCLMSLDINGKSICGREEADEGGVDLYEIGYGIFPTVALINHSCNPNVALISVGNTQIAVAIAGIAANGEIYICYQSDALATAPLCRRESLRDQYYFDCRCEACAQNWPMHSQLTDQLVLKCPLCSSPFGLLKCDNCNTLASDIAPLPGSNYASFLDVFRDKYKYVDMFNHIKTTYYMCDDYNDCKHYLIEIIGFVDKYCVSPSKLLLECQSLFIFSFQEYLTYSPPWQIGK